MIIVFEFFPYYAYWRAQGTPKLPKRIVRASLAGHRLWDEGLVEHLGERRYRVHRSKKEYDESDDDVAHDSQDDDNGETDDEEGASRKKL